MKLAKIQLDKFGAVFVQKILIIFIYLVLACCCKRNLPDMEIPGNECLPSILPDISEVTIPWNIAPLNFIIKEKGSSFNIRITGSADDSFSVKSSDGEVRFPLKNWKKLLSANRGGKVFVEVSAHITKGEIIRFKPITLYIAEEEIDPFLVYRMLYPGYEAWLDMKIVQRSTEGFSVRSVLENQLLDNNCINCHSFVKNDPSKMLLHVRGSVSGTYFTENGNVVRRSLKTENMPANVVYPSWHPSGQYVAFSSNKTVQAFHSRHEKNIEVFDLFSSLVLYDTEKNEIMICNQADTASYMETFPCWSPDGKYLYYCRTPQVAEGFDFRQVNYDLVRIPFNQNERTFGKVELLFEASTKGKSVSFPAVSPDGRSVVFTLHDYGTFSIWHREADLYVLDLENSRIFKMPVNSDESDSWHSWSSNGKWMVFSSKRDDGLSARPYICYFYSVDSIGKPFVLPQKDPGLYGNMKKTFNRPEFITGKIDIDQRDFEKASSFEPVQAVWTGPVKLESVQDKRYGNEKY